MTLNLDAISLFLCVCLWLIWCVSLLHVTCSRKHWTTTCGAPSLLTFQTRAAVTRVCHKPHTVRPPSSSLWKIKCSLISVAHFWPISTSHSPHKTNSQMRVEFLFVYQRKDCDNEIMYGRYRTGSGQNRQHSAWVYMYTFALKCY